jgi:peptidoglycan/xylan/chitin deacetylase (PgdA/CDA1 family)
VRNIAKIAARSVGLRRTHVAAARMFFERQGLATFPPSRPRNVGRILCYHSIDEPHTGVNDVRAKRFREQIELALDTGHRFVPAQHIASQGGSRDELSITFDDGCKSVLTRAAKILKEYRVPWTLFVVTNWSSHRESWMRDRFIDWAGIESLMKDGVEIGSHTRTHPDFGQIDPERMADELEGSRRDFEKKLGFAPSSFAIPLGQSMNWTAPAAAAARKAGYKFIYAQSERKRPEGTIARTFVTRFDSRRIFLALLGGAYDNWEEWV